MLRRTRRLILALVSAAGVVACGGPDFPVLDATRADGVTAAQRVRRTALDSDRESHRGWSFRFFDVSGVNQTWPESINNVGAVAGHYVDASGVEHGFVRSRTGQITVVDVSGASATELLDVNDLGVAVGDYTDADGHSHGIRRAPGGAVTVVDPPGSIDVYLGGINDRGEAVGAQGLNSDFAFLVRNGTSTPIAPPPGADPQWTNPFGINNLGTVVGSYLDPDGNMHGFALAGDQYSTVDSPLGATFLRKSNDRDLAVGGYFPYDGSRRQSLIVNLSTLVQEAFVCPSDYLGSALNGINDLGQVTGFCILQTADGSVQRHAFVASPADHEDR